MADRASSPFAFVAFLAVCAVGYFFFRGAFDSPGFSPAVIAQVESGIRTEFGKTAGTSVVEVSLIKSQKRQLTGFVRLKTEGLAQSYTKSCAATMATNGGSYIWECK